MASPYNENLDFQNTNRWSTRQMVTMALMCAISALLQFAQIPLLPAAPFLSYDPSFVPAMVSGFAYGPTSGVVIGVLASVIHGLITGEWVGALMNSVACVAYVVPAALIYSKVRTMRGAIIGLIVGIVCVVLAAIASNLTIGVWFWYGSPDVIMPLMLPAVLPFNLIKATLNSVLTIVVYKAVSNMITPKKNQVKGR
ncbi:MULTISPECIES: ECF transporter S component [unclassified Adlercreutzia]|uniref:ECF transporter S component n=1 Tax=unclassified Adlercreutzia TaxID=2636013 RepID=UPI0013EC9788|nr:MULTISPECIES: ECF transporter S component [unclassified Adlercreutzia]